eukprot:COSAG01_NODE_702_length_14141_cov_36.742739_14_plen_230_part_00
MAAAAAVARPDPRLQFEPPGDPESTDIRHIAADVMYCCGESRCSCHGRCKSTCSSSMLKDGFGEDGQVEYVGTAGAGVTNANSCFSVIEKHVKLTEAKGGRTEKTWWSATEKGVPRRPGQNSGSSGYGQDDVFRALGSRRTVARQYRHPQRPGMAPVHDPEGTAPDTKEREIQQAGTTKKVVARQRRRRANFFADAHLFRPEVGDDWALAEHRAKLIMVRRLSCWMCDC